jgi:hypothetical protein
VEVEANEPAGPLVLRNRREALIEGKFQAKVVSLDDERSPPKVRPLVANCLDQCDELPLIGGEHGMPRH